MAVPNPPPIPTAVPPRAVAAPAPITPAAVAAAVPAAVPDAAALAAPAATTAVVTGSTAFAVLRQDMESTKLVIINHFFISYSLLTFEVII
ncbi:hypothetical protein PN36_17870 [Candidatus Thiomargarita nelsonii]|uniref:Uncharacterized protein n=1 Tax=Candidatus Thiomargarita nelsonii TaxID=1003181 RepID=A0A0A6RPR9_9GAMM|nr:hypothetical protein PN36_17870 [Candidatus Thiomargarita nelsonii]